MKKLTVLALALVSTLANAEVVKILDAELPISHQASSSSYATFFINQQTGEGFARVTTTDFPASSDDVPSIIYSKTVKIENLMLMGDQVVYQGAEGNVDCGKMGVTRVFKKPTLLLSGNCSLKTKTTYGNKLEVFFTTK